MHYAFVNMHITYISFVSSQGYPDTLAVKSCHSEPIEVRLQGHPGLT